MDLIIRHARLPGHSAGELVEIFMRLADGLRCRLTGDAILKLTALMNGLDRGRGFGNGREVRNLFDKTLENQAVRLAKHGHWGALDMAMIEAEDVPGGKVAPFGTVPLELPYTPIVVPKGRGRPKKSSGEPEPAAPA